MKVKIRKATIVQVMGPSDGMESDDSDILPDNNLRGIQPYSFEPTCSEEELQQKAKLVRMMRTHSRML